MIRSRPLVALATGALLTGCAAPSLRLRASHPASALAPEAATLPARPSLQPDAETRRTRELLAERHRQAESAEAEPPVDQGTSPPPGPPKTPHHEHP